MNGGRWGNDGVAKGRRVNGDMMGGMGGEGTQVKQGKLGISRSTKWTHESIFV